MQIRIFDETHEFDEACIHLPREILVSCESVSLRELTMQVLLDLELYRILKNDARFRAPFCQVKSGVLKFNSLECNIKSGSNFQKIT